MAALQAHRRLIAAGFPLREHDEALAAQVGSLPGRPDVDTAPGFDMAVYTQAYPTVVAAITEYFQHDRTADDLFRDCLSVIIEGATKAGSSPDSS